MATQTSAISFISIPAFVALKEGGGLTWLQYELAVPVAIILVMAFLIGGIFLYTSYYGTDQSQVQRELSAATTADTKKSLLLNGFARFPLTVHYVLLGVVILAVYHNSPELMSRGFEYRMRGKTLERFVLNDPRFPEEYREFRRIVSHLQWLGKNRQLFVKPISYEQVVRAQLAGPPSAGDIANAVEKGYRWRQLADENEFEFIRKVSGSVAVTNYDPDTMPRAEQEALYEFATFTMENFLAVDIRPDYPGGDFPLFGGFKLRSLDSILAFLARTISEAPEFDVAPDPRTGPVELNPRRAMAIHVSDSTPESELCAKFAGKYYSVPKTAWDRDAFFVLYKLYQVTVTDVSSAGLPVTIAK